ncbi:MAG: cysteine--tRNA ligase [Candidatus Omnitrophota bacterium]|jgi:cysteinyl-tRNA synthetase
MPIRIYNSLSRKKEEFVAQSAPLITMYTCGITVYDQCHIGHARSLSIFEVIRRYLEYRGYTVRFVRNITDIDDKIINRANELHLDWEMLVKQYIEAYYKDLDVLGVRRGIEDSGEEPRATRNIPEMISFIKDLLDKAYAYVTESGVYFSVRKFKEYGKLSGQSIDEMLTGVRKESDEAKLDPLDFALWKRSKPGEPFWQSPWGEGRPGWHIECSVMSQKYLNTSTLDIHAGGRDLIFPHHENELAQSQAQSGKCFAKYWIHHGLLTINGQKMSKSLGNFITIDDFMRKFQNADLLKLLFLAAHYSHPVDYTDEKIQETRQAWGRIMHLMERLQRKVTPSGAPAELHAEINTVKARFIEAMDDDFNTPKALAALFELVNVTNKKIDDISFITEASVTLKELFGVLGISLSSTKEGPLADDQAINTKIAERNNARKLKDFALADKLRKELDAAGVIIEDSKEGTTWRRKL